MDHPSGILLEGFVILGPIAAVAAALIAGRGHRLKWGALNLLFWPIFFPVLLYRRAKGTLDVDATIYAGAAAADGPLPVAPVPPPDEDLSDLPEPVSACPRCGYLGIHIPTVSDGVAVGTSHELMFQVCPRCNYRGVPIVFPKREEYVAFLRALAQP